jgi:hypothetical protein
VMDELIEGTHILASECLCRVARLDDCKAFGVTLDDIVVLVMLEERLPLLAAVFTQASVLGPRSLDSHQYASINRRMC